MPCHHKKHPSKNIGLSHVDEQTMNSASASSSPVAPKSVIGSVLVADDDIGFLETTCDILRLAGHHVEGVADAKSALARLQDGRVEVLITDIMMPGSEDLDFLENLKDMGGYVPVIVVTGYPSVASAAKSLKLPVVAYLAKPLEIEAFLDDVRRAVGLSRVHRSVRRAHERAKALDVELTSTRAHFALNLRDCTSPAAIESVTALLFANVRSALADLEELVSASLLAGTMTLPEEGHAFRPLAMVELLQETVILLEKSRRDFKSKELAELRKRIERLLELPDNSRF
jgi:FixJ family two-component response regulator